MPTKLSQYCEGIMEAAWLAAVIVVPVFFNIFSSRIFEPDKLALLRTLSLVILAAWIVKLIATGGWKWEKVDPGENIWQTIRRIPLLLPVIVLTIVYLVATIFSVGIGTSFWGSYQRLQGTYTTFSYIVIFAAIAANLRKRTQVERLITIVIIASLPVSLYGYLQRIKADPVPWGGDVSSRIAANMGNSIFVAAYLIMVVPLTLIRIIQSFWGILSSDEGDRTRLLAQMARATFFILVLAFEIIALYLSGSRGPWIGWFASLVFLGLVIPLLWKLRWLTFAFVAVAAIGLIFLGVLNIPNGPLESLRSVPGIGRLGQIFDSESRTGKVRSLIWQGAAELVAPHEPLNFPDGHQDAFNFIRPLIGYGPESMYVAYNPFYPPELTQVEKRNASPDRSHNETWDSLVTTGIIGLGAYIFLFVSVFYYGLKWIGLIRSNRERNFFLGLFFGAGLLSSVIVVQVMGVGFFGVGLPLGMISGCMLYIVIAAVLGWIEVPESREGKIRILTMMGLMAVIIAHYVEINFGIAIAATRTYFWTFTGLLLVIGYILPLHGEYATAQVAPDSELNKLEDKETSESLPANGVAGGKKSNRLSQSATKKKRKAPTARNFGNEARKEIPAWLRNAFLAAILLGVILTTLGFNFISNAQGGKSLFDVLSTSLVNAKTSSGNSSGLLIMIFTSWLVGSILLSSENFLESRENTWLKSFGVILGVSISLGLLFWLWHAFGLASLANKTAKTLDDVLMQISRYEDMLTKYYLYLFILVFLAAYFIYLGKEKSSRLANDKAIAWLAAAIAGIAVLMIASYTNLRIIQADIAFKLAEPFTRTGQWPVAITVYDRANQLAPAEDYYYLFLGRAYLENAKTIQDANERENLIQQAARDLRKAQSISPLNTDHTANLARLYSLWASYSSDNQTRAERGETSKEYFEKAVTLSPNSARIWDEWALLYLNILNQPEEAFAILNHANEIDPFYDWTYGLLGDYYARSVRELQDLTGEKIAGLNTAAENYSLALKYVAPNDPQKYNYLLAMANIQAQLGNLTAAIDSYQQAIQFQPRSNDVWKIEEMIAKLFVELNDPANALIHAQNALSAAPDSEKTRLQTVVNEIAGS